MNELRPLQLNSNHVGRLAIAYVRDSAIRQGQENTASLAHRRGQEVAIDWGWAPDRIVIIDEDVERSGTDAEHRGGLRRVMELIREGRVGIVLCADLSRVTRSSADLEALLALCRVHDTFIAIDGVIMDLNHFANR